MKEAEFGDAVGKRRAADAPGLGPAGDPLLEEESVQDQLTAPFEELEERALSVGPLEAVVAIDPHHWHALPCSGELVHVGGDGLLTLGQLGESRVPLAPADDTRAGNGRSRTCSAGVRHVHRVLLLGLALGPLMALQYPRSQAYTAAYVPARCES